MNVTGSFIEDEPANLSRMLFVFAKTIDQITHSDWSNFVTHTAWAATVTRHKIQNGGAQEIGHFAVVS